MDSSGLVRLFLDWGYTRLKIWIYNREDTLCYEQSVYTSDLTDDPSFYTLEDISRVSDVIRSALLVCPKSAAISIYTSSQMHALAGTLYPNSDFISTWHDLPGNPPSPSPITVQEGIPVLSSMPSNKIRQINNSYFLDSSYFDHKTGAEQRIASLSSPFSLVFQRIFGARVPCSRTWWQSTCLRDDHPLISFESSGGYISETPVSITSDRTSSLLEIDTAVTIYPEVGDLQASTYDSICDTDVLLNLGTGSQLVFPCLSVSHDLPYFRYYSANRILPTISHIPCGRLLADYAATKSIPFSILKKTLHQLKPSDLLSLNYQLKHPLLCFPGFSSNDFRYHQNSKTSIKRVAALTNEVFLSAWVMQYYRILHKYVVNNHARSQVLLLSVVGDLGGLAEELSSLLASLLPAHFHLRRSASADLPRSLMRFHHSNLQQEH